MVTNADKLLAKAKYPLLAENEALQQYFLDKLVLWNNTLESLSQNQSYKISNGQNSSRDLERVEIDEAQSQVDIWTEKLENLVGTSIDAPKIRTVFTAGIPVC